MNYCAKCGHPESHHVSGACVWRTAEVCPCSSFQAAEGAQ